MSWMQVGEGKSKLANPIPGSLFIGPGYECCISFALARDAGGTGLFCSVVVVGRDCSSAVVATGSFAESQKRRLR